MTRRFNVGDIVPWYAGVARRKLGERLTVVLQIYCDESGKDDPPTFVIAGLIAHPDAWAALSNEWAEAIDACVKERGSAPKKHIRQSEVFGSIIRKHCLAGLSVTVDHEDYKNIFTGRFSKNYDDPYIFMSDEFMKMVHEYAKGKGYFGPIDFIFDRQLSKERDLDGSWEQLHSVMPPERAARYRSRPLFADDNEVLPLQAADVLAWHIRRAIADGHKTLEPVGPNGATLQGIFARNHHYDATLLAEAREFMMGSFVARNTLPEGSMNVLSYRIGSLKSAENYVKIAAAKPGDELELTYLPAIGTERFLLVHKCETIHSPHLHRRSNNACLEETAAAEVIWERAEWRSLPGWWIRLRMQ